MTRPASQRRAQRALERQLAYQQEKARAIRGREEAVIADRTDFARSVRAEIEEVRPISAAARVLEVGSGAHGLIFFFDGAERVGVDPLADHYKALFPAWQCRARTIAAFGERLPFEDGSFDVVLCDNVVDHAEDPRRIVEEIARVLAPEGVLYFTVNVHHPFYHWAATAHALWQALGVRFEVTPFADHTVHLTKDGARRLFDGLPLTLLREADTIVETRREGRTVAIRHAGDKFKRVFFKNALWKTIAVKSAGGSP